MPFSRPSSLAPAPAPPTPRPEADISSKPELALFTFAGAVAWNPSIPLDRGAEMSSLPCPPDIRDKRSAPVRVLVLLPPALEADEAEEMRDESEEAALAAWNASCVHAPSEPPGGLCDYQCCHWF